MTLAGLLYRALDPYAPSSSYDVFAYFWAIYNLLCIATAVRVCIEPAQRRQQERFRTGEAAGVIVEAGKSSPASFRDVSVGGAALSADFPVSVGDRIGLEMRDVGIVQAVVVRANGTGQVAVEFEASAEQRERLIRKLYSERYVRPIIDGNIWQILRGVLANAFT